MSKKKKTQTHSYAYDPLDRHVISQGANADNTQLFYCRDRVATEHLGNVGLRIFECEEAVLSYQVHQNGTPKALLIAGEENRSTLTVLNNSQQHSIAYTPYGHHLQEADTPQLLGFNGERFDPFTGYYLLGNGYRAFNPVLMRFNSPDSWSPFGKGGINAYAYCKGDPVNLVDIDGHMPFAARWITEAFTSAPPLPRRIPLVTRQSRAMERLMKTPIELEGLPRGTDYIHGNRIAIPTNNPDIYLDFTFPLERKAVVTLREHGVSVLPQHRAPLPPPTPARNLSPTRLSSRNPNSGHDNPAFVDSEAPPLPPRLPARNSNLNIENKASSVRKKL